MQVYPAIDIKDGRVLRLVDRAPRAARDRLADPLALAEAFAAQGASWLHVVDMNRALRTGKTNGAWVRRICALPGVQVQVGGNVDSLEWVAEAVEAGATRVVLGTVAAQSSAFERLLDLAGLSRAAVNIDVRDGVVAARDGTAAPMTAVDLARRVRQYGVRLCVYRDLARDGMVVGADLDGAAALKREGVAVIAAGGVATLDEIAAAARRGLAGVIVGRALYDGRFSFRAAARCWQ